MTTYALASSFIPRGATTCSFAMPFSTTSLGSDSANSRRNYVFIDASRKGNDTISSKTDTRHITPKFNPAVYVVLEESGAMGAVMTASI